MLYNSNSAHAQYKPSRILFLIDGSSSMTYEWNSTNNRFGIARELVLRIMDSIYRVNNEVQFAVRVYGSEFPSIEKNCYDSKLIVPFAYQNLAQINLKLKYLNTQGVSPIAYSLQQAAENELGAEQDYDYSFILITDGGESCNGDVCAAYQKVLQKKVKVIPYIIGLDKNSNLDQYYNCLGKYVDVTSNNDIEKAVSFIVKENLPLLEKPKTLKNLKTEFSNLPPVKKDSIIEKPVVIAPIVEKPLLVDQLAYLSGQKPLLFKNDIKAGPAGKRLKYVSMQLKRFEEEMVLSTSSIQSLYFNENLKTKTFKPSIQLADKLNRFKKLYLPEFDFEADVQQVSALNKLEIKNYNPLIPFQSAKTLKFKPLNNDFSDWEVLETQTIGFISSKNVRPRTDFGYEQKNVKKLSFFNINLNQLELEPELVYTAISALNSNATIKSKVQKFKLNDNAPKLKYGMLYLPEDFIEPDLTTINISGIYSLPYSQPFQYTIVPKEGIKLKYKKLALPDYAPEPPAKAATPENNTNNAIVERSNAANTTLEILFTDGKGKFYTNKPKVKLVESASQKTYKQTIRSVFQGQPEPIKIDKPGTYDIIVENPQGVDLVQKAFVIEENKNNKVTFIVGEGTLIFTYMGNYKRPIEYQAKVIRRFSTNNYSRNQPCTEKYPYEPGEYSIEINTMPPQYLSTQIFWDAITEIQIAQPGTLQITNTKPIGKVELYDQDGEGQYRLFYTMNVSGNPEDQKLVMQPGPPYIAKYLPANAPPGTSQVQTVFRVQSNKQTDLKLDEPGYLILKNKKPVGPITIYAKDGDEKIKLKNTVLTGNGVSQNLALQPGQFLITYRKKGTPAGAPDDVYEFVISPAQKTEVELE